MMITRTSLPWPTIASEVRAAIRAYAKHEGAQPFIVSARRLADYIVLQENGNYPHLTEGCSFSATQQRCTEAMTGMNWKIWSRSGRDGTKFMVPWDDRQPYQIREIKPKLEAEPIYTRCDTCAEFFQAEAGTPCPGCGKGMMI